MIPERIGNHSPTPFLTVWRLHRLLRPRAIPFTHERRRRAPEEVVPIGKTLFNLLPVCVAEGEAG